MSALSRLLIRSRWLAIFLLVFCTSAAPALCGTVTLSWDPNTEPDLAGYVVAYGTQSGTYATTVDVGNLTTYSVNVVDGQRYYFVVQAYNVGGLYSAYSQEVTALVAPPTQPAVTAVSPAAGLISGGTAVTITGSNFRAGAVAYFGTVRAASTVIINATTISAITAAAAAGGLVDVRVTNSDATSGSLAGAFTYIDPRVTVTGVVPGAGPTSGGTVVTITGTNFAAGASVAFGGMAATGVTVVDATTLVAIAPARPSGAVDVTVTVGGQTGVKPAAFTYVSGVPAVTSIVPSQGSNRGGTAVTIAGTAFTAGVVVTIGGVPATAVQVLSDTVITAVTGALPGAGSAPVAADVTVTSAAGQSTTLAAGFTYVSMPPVVSTVSPPSGTTSGGTHVTLVGADFVSGASVTFDGVAAASVVFVNANTLQVVTPPHAAGPVSLVVTNPGGQTGAAPTGFTFVGPDPTTDTDGDGLPDAWENQFGLDPNDPSGDQGASGDPDHDGVSNAQEYLKKTHPRGMFTRYFAEGVSTTFFNTVLAFANADQQPATVLVHFLRDDGNAERQFLTIDPMSRRTLDTTTIAGLTGRAFSTTIESDRLVVADRTVSWDTTGYGAHAETAIVAPAPVWYLAEGATHSGFDLFYLIQNPNPQAVSVEVKYLLPNGAPEIKVYRIGPNSRYTIWVDLADRRLASTDVSAVLTCLEGLPIIVERSMYSNAGGRSFGAGQNGAGVTAPALRWFLAEGATGRMFDLFVLIANPGSTTADVTATYMLPNGGTVQKTYRVAPASRFNVWVDLEDARLADTAVSTIVESTNGVPIIVERAMWWPGPTPSDWRESHNSAGATETGTRWALAEGEDGGPQARATFVLIANTSSYAGAARVQLLFEDGTTDEKTIPLPANSRVSIAPGWEFPSAKDRRFAVVVESLGATPAEIVVERAMYWNANGEVWAAGTNALGTLLP